MSAAQFSNLQAGLVYCNVHTNTFPGGEIRGQLALVVVDTTTQPPTLTAPAPGTVTGTPISVHYTLPEAALAGSVQLTFTGEEVSTLTLDAAHSTAAMHTLSVDATNLAATTGVSGVGGAPMLADGVYTVRLSYQDALGNPPASAANAHVVLYTGPPGGFVVNTHEATGATATGATLNGITWTGTFDLDMTFEYGTNPNFGIVPGIIENGSPLTVFGGGNIASITATLTGLAPGTTYYFRLLGDDEFVVGGGATKKLHDIDEPAAAAGTFVVSPPSPVPLATLLTGSFSGWIDPEGNTPLTYEILNGAIVIVPDGTNAAPSFTLPPGTYTITGRVRDSLGLFTDTDVSVTVDPPTDPVTTLLFAKDAAVPYAGLDPYIPTTAIWKTFGPPAVNDVGQVAFLGSWKKPPGTYGGAIFVDGVGLVYKGADATDAAGLPIPGVKLAALSDPMLNHAGNVAFIATLSGTGVTPANNKALYFVEHASHAPEMLARTGDTLADASGAAIKSITAASLCETESVLFFSALLAQGSGAPVVDKTNDAVLCSVAEGGTPATQLREGSAISGFPGSPLLKSFVALKPRPGSAGNGRGVIASGAESYVPVYVAGSLGERGIGYVGSAGDTAFPYTLTSEPPGYGTGSTFTLFGLPTQDENSSLAFRANAKGGTATMANNSALFGEDEDFDLARLVTKGDTATGMPAGAIFAALRDPVATFEQQLAFTASVSGGGVVATDNEGVFYRDTAGTITLVAREGGQPPGAPAGAKFRAFTSLALPEGAAGPIFVAALVNKTPNPPNPALPGPGGITTIDDIGVWAVASNGDLKQLFREGDMIAGKTLKSFTILNAVPLSGAQTRSFNHTGLVTWRATFTDLTTAIMTTSVP